MTEAERLRTLWRRHFDECAKIFAENDARHERFMRSHAAGRQPIDEDELPIPTFPDELRGLRCGARNRKGEPCKQSDLGRNGRCKFHGGMSTGPKTASGKARAKANLALRHVGAQSLSQGGVASELHGRTRNDNKIARDGDATGPHGQASNGNTGGMAEADILASIAAVAAKRRARR